MIALPFATALALLPFLQSGGESATSIYADEQKSWSLEYPALIEPFVDDYYNCLQSGMRFVNVEARFEEQHAADVPRCATVRSSLETEANALLKRRGKADETTPADVTRTFDILQRIHIERGRDLDDHIRLRAEARERYWAEHQHTERTRQVTVVELNLTGTGVEVNLPATQTAGAVSMPNEDGNAAN